jgi:hypothetical protein
MTDLVAESVDVMAEVQVARSGQRGVQTAA